MSKILVFIDADPVIRHFILSKQLEPLAAAHDVTYVFNDETGDDPKKRRIKFDYRTLNLGRMLSMTIGRRRHGLWYPLFTANVLRTQRGTPNFSARRFSFLRVMGERRVRRYEFLGLPGIFQIFRFLYMRFMGIHGELDRLIRREMPDAIVYPTLLNGPFMNELALICEKLKIPLVALMNSWDNPSSKATVVGKIDYLVVWGNQTRDHAVTYLNIPRERVLCFGAAQFQVYRTPPVESNEELRRQFNVSPNKPLLLYAGSHAGPHETEYLQALERGIREGIIPDCHVVYRPHPWRSGLANGETDFFDLGLEHVTMDPHMEAFYRNRVATNKRGLYMADYRITNKLITIVDAVVSPLSTLLLESLINLKPIVVLYPEERHHNVFNIGRVHQQVLKGMAGVVPCHRLADVAACCAEVCSLIGNADVTEAMRGQVDELAVMDGPTYGERLVDLCDQVTGTRRRPDLADGRPVGALAGERGKAAAVQR